MYMLKKNENLTLLDNPQIMRHTFDEEHDAQRVIVVGSDIAKAVKEGLKDLKIEVKPEWPKGGFLMNARDFPVVPPKITKEIEFKEIEKIVYIEKPIIQTEFRIIEVPIIPKAFLYLFGVQILISLITLLIK